MIVKPNWNILLGTDGAAALGELYRLGGLDDRIEADSPDNIRKLLRHPNPEIRERAIFVFGIKSRHAMLCADFEAAVIDASPRDWVVVSGALHAMRAADCPPPSAALCGHLLVLLKDAEARKEIGPLIRAWIRRAYAIIDDGEYTRETLLERPISDAQIEDLASICRLRR